MSLLRQYSIDISGCRVGPGWSQCFCFPAGGGVACVHAAFLFLYCLDLGALVNEGDNVETRSLTSSRNC
jgi:hypothetical protein